MSDPYRHGDRIEEVVAWHARRTPDRVALEYGRRRVNYRELMARASGVSRVLTAHGMGPKDLVPVICARTPELVYATLGILCAGAAYALIDPGWPARRIDAVIDELAAPLVLVDDPGRMAPLQHAGREGLVIAAAARPASSWAQAPAAATNTVACVYFTSGTTGTPKGILSPHRGTLRTLIDSPALGFDAATVTLQAAAVSWDAMSLELWAGLLNGGRCVLLDGAAGDRTAIHAAIEQHHVNTVWLTASLFAGLVEAMPHALADTRLVMTGGERVSLPHVRAFARACPGVTLVNGYGPGEATIFTTTHRVRPGDLDPGAADLPIGTPLPRTEVLVVDADLRSVPAGVTGQIAIGGDGLATGYLNDEAETRRRFRTLRRPDSSTGRFYLSGDLGRADCDGRLWYQGRMDRQIKLDGVRIEPGEIETAMEQHLEVGRCAVTITPGRKLLAAYTSTHGRPISGDDLRAHAARLLITPMIPALYRHMLEMPTTAVGKTDYRAIAGVAAHPARTLQGG